MTTRSPEGQLIFSGSWSHFVTTRGRDQLAVGRLAAEVVVRQHTAHHALAEHVVDAALARLVSARSPRVGLERVAALALPAGRGENGLGRAALGRAVGADLDVLHHTKFVRDEVPVALRRLGPLLLVGRAESARVRVVEGDEAPGSAPKAPRDGRHVARTEEGALLAALLREAFAVERLVLLFDRVLVTRGDGRRGLHAETHAEVVDARPAGPAHVGEVARLGARVRGGAVRLALGPLVQDALERDLLALRRAAPVAAEPHVQAGGPLALARADPLEAPVLRLLAVVASRLALLADPV